MIKKVIRNAFKEMSVNILSGQLKGIKWIPASGGKVFRILFGSYEPQETNLISNMIKPGDVVYDVGASLGYYTLLSAKLVGEHGRVAAIEACPKNVDYLQKHIKINGLKNVSVFGIAAGKENGQMNFSKGSGSGTGHLSEQGDISVEVKPLDAIIQKSGNVPTHIKMDVEGAEWNVLRGLEHTLRTHHPILFLSTHGNQIKKECSRFLMDLGYKLSPIVGTNIEETSEILCV